MVLGFWGTGILKEDCLNEKGKIYKWLPLSKDEKLNSESNLSSGFQEAGGRKFFS